MKQIVDKLNKIAKKIDESVEIPQTDLIIDSLDAITKAYGGTPNDSHLIVDKLEDIYNNIGAAPSGNIEITENTAEGEPLDISQYATATVNVSGSGSDFTTAELTLRKTALADYDPVATFSILTPVIYNEEYAPIQVLANNDSITVLLPLYQGSVVFDLNNFIPNLAYSYEQALAIADATGDAVFDYEDGLVTITGDCSFGVGFQK